MEKSQTVVVYPGQTEANGSIVEADRLTWDFQEQSIHGTNILGLIIVSMVRPGNTKGGSITAPLTSCLTV